MILLTNYIGRQEEKVATSVVATFVDKRIKKQKINVLSVEDWA